MDENTALNGTIATTTTTTQKHDGKEKKGYLPLVVTLAFLLGLAFYAGQRHGVRTSLAGSGGTASLVIPKYLQDEENYNDALHPTLAPSTAPPFSSGCAPITVPIDCVAAKDADGVECWWYYSFHLGRDACMTHTAVLAITEHQNALLGQENIPTPKQDGNGNGSNSNDVL